jgi:hypothetical protein
MPEYSIEEYADMYFVYGNIAERLLLLSEGRYANACIRANGGHFEHLL